MKSDIEYAVVLIDATESPIERPRKSKNTTIQVRRQVVINQKSPEGIGTNFTNGKRDDFRLFKETSIHIHPEIKVITARGYQGIGKLHKNSELPKKKRKHHALTKQEKKKGIIEA